MSDYRSRVYNSYLSYQQPMVRDIIRCMDLRRPYLEKLIHQHFPNDHNSNILDLGCGYGILLHFADQAGYKNIKGVDVSRQRVKVAQKLGNRTVEYGDALVTLSKESNSTIDCLITFDLIEHFDHNELLNVIDNVKRVLKQQGRWIIHTPNAESPFGMRIRYGDITHKIAFTQESLSQILIASGFSKVNCYEDLPVVHGVKSSFRYVAWKIIRNILRFYLSVETGGIGDKAIFSQNFLAVAYK